MLGIGKKGSKMQMANLYSQMVIYMMGIGKMEKCMEKEHTKQMEQKFKPFGNMEI